MNKRSTDAKYGQPMDDTHDGVARDGREADEGTVPDGVTRLDNTRRKRPFG